MQNLQFLRVASVAGRADASESSLRGWVKAGLWPKPAHLGPRTSGWYRHEVDAMLAARAGGQPESKIRDLVRDIEAQRAALAAKLSQAVAGGV